VMHGAEPVLSANPWSAALFVGLFGRAAWMFGDPLKIDRAPGPKNRITKPLPPGAIPGVFGLTKDCPATNETREDAC